MLHQHFNSWSWQLLPLYCFILLVCVCSSAILLSRLFAQGARRHCCKRRPPLAPELQPDCELSGAADAAAPAKDAGASGGADVGASVGGCSGVANCCSCWC